METRQSECPHHSRSVQHLAATEARDRAVHKTVGSLLEDEWRLMQLASAKFIALPVSG